MDYSKYYKQLRDSMKPAGSNTEPVDLPARKKVQTVRSHEGFVKPRESGGLFTGLAGALRSKEEKDAKAEEKKNSTTPESPAIVAEYLGRMNFQADKEIGSPVEGDVGRAREALGMTESSGNYKAVGPVVEEGMYAGDRAYGKYQVMGENIPSWTEEILGKAYTIEEFLSDKAAQDKVAEYRLQASYDEHGTWEDAVSVWFSGRPMKTAGNADDGYLSVPQYVTRFQKFFGRT